MTTTLPVQSATSYLPVLSYAAPEADTVIRDQKVNPVPRLPSKPNLSKQFGDTPPADYTVYLPAKKADKSVGPTYSDLNPAKPRKAG
jgi:hypothetical protein